MEFGHIEGPVDNIDLTLPADGEITSKTLNTSAVASDEFKVYIGAHNWAIRSWIGKLYPVGTPDADFLKVYIQNFNAVEVGTTFFALYTKDGLKKLTDVINTSPEFKCCPKFPQIISHYSRLRNVDDVTTKFYEGLEGFGDQIGALILQLSEAFTPASFPVLKSYLESLPQTYKVALDIRNKEWYSDRLARKALLELMHTLNIGSVIVDSPARRDCCHMELPTPDVLIRYVGHNWDNSDRTRLDEWVERIKVWRERGLRSVYFFVYQHDNRYVAETCDYLIKQINTQLDMQLKAPVFINDFLEHQSIL